jgi:uncharacterized membrane protein
LTSALVVEASSAMQFALISKALVQAAVFSSSSSFFCVVLAEAGLFINYAESKRESKTAN